MTSNKLEDGLYIARSGNLERVKPEEDVKKIRVTTTTFEMVQEIQRRMRKHLGGYKPDLGLVAEALLRESAQSQNVEELVRTHAMRVFADND